MKNQVEINARWVLFFLVLAALCWAVVILIIAMFLNSDGLIIAITVMAVLFLFTGYFLALEIKKSEPMPDESPQAEKEAAENQKCQ